MFLFWVDLGGAIGAYAAVGMGFSTIGGVIGGLLLAPLAVLFFFVSGGVSANKRPRKWRDIERAWEMTQKNG